MHRQTGLFKVALCLNNLKVTVISMGRHTIFVTIALAFVWNILMEEFSWQNAAVGMFMGILTMHFVSKFFNFEDIANVSFFKLILFPFWLIGRIYMDAIFLIKLILRDAKWGIMVTKLDLKSETLWNILADSITLTPGSVYLDHEEQQIMLLCIGDRKKVGYPGIVSDLKSIEGFLQKSQKQ